MKRLLNYLLCVALFVSCNSNESSIPQVKFGGLNGNVLKLKETHYTVTQKFGEMLPDEITQISINEFDKDGNSVQLGFYKEDGSFYYKIKTEWKDGKAITETHYSDNNEEPTITLSVAERSKNYVKWTVNPGKEDESFREQFIDGLTVTSKNDKGEIETVLKYDKKGFVIEQKQITGSMAFRVVSELDDKGNPLKQIMYDEDGESSTRTYTYPDYDKKGNWITQVITEDGTVEEIVKREISYR